MNTLLPNLPVEDLNKDNDYLGIIEKGELIKLFLELNTEQLLPEDGQGIKMFALYGEWGSGKSTLMKYLTKELGSFNTFFFDSWKYEKDENLAFSLLEFLSEELKGEKICREILDLASRIIVGSAKSLSFGIPGVSVRAKELFDELEKEDEETPLHQAIKKFEGKFDEFENLIRSKKGKDFNIVFIDDLDRCEPENVLNLLSAIKLFFTYGKRTIFFCGIDKKAVEEAVKTK